MGFLPVHKEGRILFDHECKVEEKCKVPNYINSKISSKLHSSNPTKNPNSYFLSKSKKYNLLSNMPKVPKLSKEDLAKIWKVQKIQSLLKAVKKRKECRGNLLCKQAIFFIISQWPFQKVHKKNI